MDTAQIPPKSMNLHVEHHLEQELLICKKGDTTLKYRVYQVYGQKFVKIMDNTRAPEPTTEVYAVNIPRNMAVEDVFKFFIRSGDVFQLRLLMDYSGTNRGQCFVQYHRQVEARRAVCCLHNEEIDQDHRLTIKLSLDNNQLLLKAIPSFISDEQLVGILKNIIGEGLRDVMVRPSRVPFKNCAICTYRDHQFAILAHKKAWPFINIAGFIVEVQWAAPELLRYAVNLYFTNFPPDLTKEEFFEILCKKIDIMSLIQFRFCPLHGYMTFMNLPAMLNAEAALYDLNIRGCILRLNRVPFPVLNFGRPSYPWFDWKMFHQFSQTPPPPPPLACRPLRTVQPFQVRHPPPPPPFHVPPPPPGFTPLPFSMMPPPPPQMRNWNSNNQGSISMARFSLGLTVTNYKPPLVEIS